MKLFKIIGKTWNSFVKNRRILPLAMFIDLLFILGLTKLHYEVFNRASMVAIKLTSMISTQVGDISTATGPPNLALLQSPEFMSLYKQLLEHIAIFTLGVFVLWLVAKGIVWFIAHKSVAKKIDIKQYALKFLGMTSLWFIAVILISVIALNILDYALFGVFPLINQTGANVIAVALYWVLSYFVFISYALLPKKVLKPTFVIGWKSAKDLFPVHILNALIFFVITTVPTSLLKIDMYLMLAFVVLIALPALAWTRIFWITAVQKVARNG